MSFQRGDFKVGDKVRFLQDPENVPYEVLWVSPNGLYGTLKRTDKVPPSNVEVPFRVLEKQPEPPKVYGPGSLILDAEGDYWLSGPDGLWEYITLDGRVSSFRAREGLSFDTTLKDIEQGHGPVKDVYVAPVK